MLQEIWITRHGFREDWVNDNPPLPTHRSYDPPLSSLGEEQAEELGTFLSNKGIERVYSSPFYRVLQSVYPLVEKTNVPLYIENSMGEWYGLHYEYYKQPAPIDELRSHFPRIDPSNTSAIELPTRGETEEEIHARVQRGLEALVQKLDAEGVVSRVLLAGHAASVICAVRGLLGDRHAYVRSGTCSLSKLERQQNGRWIWVLNGDCSHLSQGEKRSWMFHGDVPDYTQSEKPIQ